jgi:hypothetical protein
MYRKTPAKFGPVDETAVLPLAAADKEKALQEEGPFSIMPLMAYS